MKETLIDNTKLTGLTNEKVLNHLFNSSFFLKSAIAFWKLPSENEIFFLADLSENFRPQKTDIHSNEKGFIFSPFLNPQNQESYFLKSDFFFTLRNRAIVINPAVNEDQKKNKILNEIMSFDSVKNQWNNSLLPKINIEVTNKEQYISLIEQALLKIRNNEFKKVVLARKKKISLNPDFHPTDLFLKLSKKYSESFISLVSIPGIGIWIGASPETLVSVKENIFRTVALAGTQLLNENEPISKAVWTQKEIEEQALVKRYIINCFKKIRLREFEEDGPRTVRAGNLIHLKTDYTVNMKETNFPDLGTIMLDLLHPTSAVCGMPKEASLNFIQEREGMNRKFYSGFLGPVNINEATDIFVNLRCAELGKGEAILYSGAGITSESIPEKEYEETEMKMRTIGDIMMNDE